MPNWTSNEVRFKSRINSKQQLSRLKKRLKGVEYLVELESGEKTKEWNDFDFNKIHKMPKGLENTISPTRDEDKVKAKRRLKNMGQKIGMIGSVKIGVLNGIQLIQKLLKTKEMD